MAKINDVLDLLNNLIHSTIHDMVKMSKNALFNIKTCLQDAQDKIEFLQLESQLQQHELQKKSHHSELVSVQKIERDSHRKKEYKVAVDSHQFLVQENIFMYMQQLSLHFPSPSSDLGKSLSTTST